MPGLWRDEGLDGCECLGSGGMRDWMVVSAWALAG